MDANEHPNHNNGGQKLTPKTLSESAAAKRQRIDVFGANVQRRLSFSDATAQAQSPDRSLTNQITTPSRSRRKPETNESLSPSAPSTSLLRPPGTPNSRTQSPTTTSSVKNQARFTPQLKSFVSSPLASRWCRYEWFISPVDAAALNEDSFATWLLKKHGSEEHSMHSAQEWAQYRSEKLSNAGLRRFSPKFIEQERVKFHQLRAKIRMLQKTNGAIDIYPNIEVLNEVPPLLCIGDRVLVRLPFGTERVTELEKFSADSGGFAKGLVVLVDQQRDQCSVYFEGLNLVVVKDECDVMLLSKHQTTETENRLSFDINPKTSAPSSPLLNSTRFKLPLLSKQLQQRETVPLLSSRSNSADSPVWSSPVPPPDVASGDASNPQSTRSRILRIVRDLMTRNTERPSIAALVASIQAEANLVDIIPTYDVNPEQSELAHGMILLLRLLKIKEFFLEQLHEMNVQAELTYAKADDKANWRWDKNFQEQYAWILAELDEINSALAPSAANIRQRIHDILINSSMPNGHNLDTEDENGAAAPTSMSLPDEAWQNAVSLFDLVQASSANSMPQSPAPEPFVGNGWAHSPGPRVEADGLALLAKVTGLESEEAAEAAPVEAPSVNANATSNHTKDDAIAVAAAAAAAAAGPLVHDTRERINQLIINCTALTFYLAACAAADPQTQPPAVEVELALESALASIRPASGNLDNLSIYHKISDAIDKIKIAITGASFF